MRSLVVLALLVATPAVGAPQNDARTFVEQLYAAYARQPGPDYLGRAADRTFAQPLLALMRKDEALTPPGEVGALDGDPICDCQDYRISKVAITLSGPTGAPVAQVRFLNFDQARTVRLDLVREADGWRVADVHAETLPSLVGLLTDSIAEHGVASKSPTSSPR